MPVQPLLQQICARPYFQLQSLCWERTCTLYSDAGDTEGNDVSHRAEAVSRTVFDSMQTPAMQFGSLMLFLTTVPRFSGKPVLRHCTVRIINNGHSRHSAMHTPAFVGALPAASFICLSTMMSLLLLVKFVFLQLQGITASFGYCLAGNLRCNACFLLGQT